jgi:uncharacterized protein involved in exopolysaccharide biosynthesis/Mrp family chromosome partitioning ATPase
MFTTENAPGDSDRAATPPPQAASAAPADAGRPSLSVLANPLWVLGTLWRRKGLILLCGLAGLVLASLASLLITPKYVSTAQLFIDPRDLRVLQNEVSPTMVGSDPTSITAYLESQARIIASDSIKARVVESEHLDSDPEFGGSASPGLLSRLFGGAPSKRDGMLYALAELDRRVSVRRGERTFVIDISVTSRDPEKAARLANALANAYLENQAAVRDAAAKRATESLTGRLEELRSRLRDAENKAERFKEANNLVAAGGRSISEEQLALSNAQLVAARTRVTEAKAKYDEIARTRASSLEAGAIPEALASNTMTALRAQLGAALSREADLTASLGARHPSLFAAQSQVRDARRQIAEELGRIARAARSEYDRALAAERQTAARVDELKSGQFAAGRAGVELRELEREVESSRVIYEGFLKRARETGELSGIDTTNARIISQAMPPLQKSGMSRRTIALLGGIGGSGVGALLALALTLLGTIRPAQSGAAPAPAPAEGEPPARSDRPQAAAPAAATPTVRTAAAQMPAAQVPAAQVPAAQVPAVRSVDPEPTRDAPAKDTPAKDSPAAAASPAKAGWRRLTSLPGGKRLPEVLATTAAPLLATLPAVRHRRWRREPDETRSVFQGKGPLVDVLDKPQASFARAVGQVREALQAAAGGNDGRRILIVGMRPGAGASTLALNLALDAALAGKAAILVDAGVGAANLTTTFAKDAQTGLADIVSGTAGVVRAALQDEGTGLFFLPRRGPTTAITGAKISREFFGAARRFGPIIVDGAALGSDELTLHFAEAVDDIVLVLREGEVGRGDIERAAEALGAQAGKIRGFVVNQA